MVEQDCHASLFVLQFPAVSVKLFGCGQPEGFRRIFRYLAAIRYGGPPRPPSPRRRVPGAGYYLPCRSHRPGAFCLPLFPPSLSGHEILSLPFRFLYRITAFYSFTLTVYSRTCYAVNLKFGNKSSMGLKLDHF